MTKSINFYKTSTLKMSWTKLMKSMSHQQLYLFHLETHFLQNDKWEIATRSNIGANCRFNNHKTFREMFFEAAEAKGFTFDLLEKDYSYSFVLQHPENRIVVPFDKADLVLVEIFDNISHTNFLFFK